VERLQRRLVALHYDVGPFDGVFGVSTRHAVVAFQKVNRLARTGVVSASVWSRMWSGTVPGRLRYLTAGNGLEVDVGLQVMYGAVDGSLRRIYDVSTGRSSLPTPLSGSSPFHVWKRTLQGTTGLGDLEQFVHYFFPGSLLAIHGYDFVPPFPASHGCVRVPTASAARLWSTTYLNEPVFIYR
jgi:peptidoglycan hydrolase-like protein with peptidoglycan-binding domain